MMSLRSLIVGGTLAACGGNSSSTPDAEPPCVPAEPPAADCSDRCFDARGPELRLALDVNTLGLAAPPAGSRPIRVAIFYTVAPHAGTWTADDFANRVRGIVTSTNTILAQCQMHVEIEAAQVVAIPARLLDITGNEEGSFGGHPPVGTPNPDLFDYNQNERLTAESLELFKYGKQHSSPNTISAFTVDHIVYYANQMLDEAGGLSYPPNIYHHVDDYPYRNSVLLVPQYGACGALPGPAANRTLAHEIGHMLLNTGGHEGASNNLLVNGTVLTAAQCQTMAANLQALFGEAAVPDPGPPS